MRQQLVDLRSRMKEEKIDAYIIPTTDFHGSEYVNDFFKCRKFVSGFTGSAGTLVVTETEAKLWTDGRYFIQAANQLEGTGIDLMKMGEADVPTITEYLKSIATDNFTIGFDGRVIDTALGKTLEEIGTLVFDKDLVGDIWSDRPEIVPSKIRTLSREVTGEKIDDKLLRIRKFMEAVDADYHLLTKLEDIAWLLNMRASDVAYTPVFFSYALISKNFAFVYVMDDSLDNKHLENIDIKPYTEIFDDITKLPKGNMLLDESVVSYYLYKLLPEKVEVINGENPTELMKSIKNDKEISSTKAAHIKDGTVMTKFVYWLKQQINKTVLTEMSVGKHLDDSRLAQESCFDLSFETIAGYAENGAIVHYAATPETNKALDPEGFILVDSGGQYEDGTTDITRTIALGPLTEEMKIHYTTVLRGHIDLAMAKFPGSLTDVELDAIARKPLWERNMDYNHGTGHGVGHLLSVHEGPQWLSPRGGKVKLVPGMITSDEPGYYLEGQYGIRIENELLCVKLPTGQLGFESLTFCPYEMDAILPELLTEEEKIWLNSYNANLYKTISPMLDEEEAKWLEGVTKAI